MLISICVPNYNRPKELYRLLKSIDCSNCKDIEIVICDDNSPNKVEIRETVNKFKQTTLYMVSYVENQSNLGYDKNLQVCALEAKGDWILYMGNDDEFVKGALDKLIQLIKKNEKNDIGYILKSHYFIHKNKKKERFKYYSETMLFEAGISTYIQMFRKSVFISGFTIKRALITPLLKDDFNGTLLFQLYLLAEVTMNYNSMYFDEPLTQQYDEGFPEFGNAESEKGLYTPGKKTIDSCINFFNGYFKITQFIDDKYSISSTRMIKKDMSKYFYPSLAVQREKGIVVFIEYIGKLKSTGLNCTIYYYIYIHAYHFRKKYMR